MKYLLLFLPLNLYAQFWTAEVKPSDSSVKKVGEWKHMNNTRPDGTIQDGSFATSDGAYLEYRATMKRIDIHTEVSPNHSNYIVNINGKDVATVNVNGPFKRDSITFSYEFSGWTNTVRIRGPRYYVINSLVKYVNYDPNYDCKGDTIFISDTIKIEDTDKYDSLLNEYSALQDENLLLKYQLDSAGSKIDTVFIKPSYYFLPDSIEFKLLNDAN